MSLTEAEEAKARSLIDPTDTAWKEQKIKWQIPQDQKGRDKFKDWFIMTVGYPNCKRIFALFDL